MRNRWGVAAKRCATAVLVAGLGLPGSASAMLISRGADLVYDDVLDITWTRNASLPGSSGLSWTQANAWAADLVYAGYDDWRLPFANVSAGAGPTTTAVDCARATELACRDNEMGYMYYQNLPGLLGDFDKTGTRTAVGGEELTGIQPVYWSGTEFALGIRAWDFNFHFGVQNDFREDNQMSAWAVRSGDVRAAVPEPQTYALLLAGLGLLGWWRTKKPKKPGTDHVF
jgi:hypothetical protein